MTTSGRRVRAIARKELREYRRTGSIIAGMAVLPVVFLISPLVQVFVVPASAASTIRHQYTLIYLLAIPALVPAALASYAIVGERQQGTLEPVLATPLRRTELVLGKALAAFVPSVVIAYVVFGLFLAVVEVGARPVIADALIRGPEVVVQVLFTPLLAAWSIWVGMAVSTRCKDVRTASQFAVLATLPAFAITALIAYAVIPASLQLAVGLAAALLIVDRLGWRVVSAMFDAERLITGSS